MSEKFANSSAITVLDYGYVRFIEAWGRGLSGVLGNDCERGIIEAARQSTQGSFRSWGCYLFCEQCEDFILGEDEAAETVLGTEHCSHKWKKYPKGDTGLLSHLFNSKPQHSTPFEFAGMTIEVQAPIFVFREWHRHRTQSYNEMSARYTALPNLNYMPDIDRLLANTSVSNKQAGKVEGAKELSYLDAVRFQQDLQVLYEETELFYQEALTAGVPKELARVILPVGRYSRMRASANLRNWLGFLTLRNHPKAQWEIQQYAKAVDIIVTATFPKVSALFDALLGDEYKRETPK